VKKRNRKSNYGRGCKPENRGCS